MGDEKNYSFKLGRPIGQPDNPTRDYTKAESTILKPYLVKNTPGVTNPEEIWKQAPGYLFLATYKAIMADRHLNIKMSHTYVDSTAEQIQALITEALNASDKGPYTQAELNQMAGEIKSKFLQEATQPPT